MTHFITTTTFQVVSILVVSKNISHLFLPIFNILVSLSGVVTTFFLVQAGITYMTSSGQPEKIIHAKKIIRNSIIGLILIISAGIIANILLNTYSLPSPNSLSHVPILNQINPSPTSSGIVTIIIDAIMGLLRNIIVSIATPFINSLSYFTHGTPLMASNTAIFNIWLITSGIADSLFLIVIALLGFHIIGSVSLGFAEVDLKQLLPQIVITFLFINSSIFIIDTVIDLSNMMIQALYNSFPSITVWNVLIDVSKQSSHLGLAALFILIIFVILSVILLIYYVMRLVVLYLGAILSPLIIMLWLLPSFKDFVTVSIKTYLTTIFVLFVHVIILLLASILFTGMINNNSSTNINPIMSTIVGIATLITLLKTQKMLTELNYVSVGPSALRKLSGHFINGVSHINQAIKG